MYVLRSLCTALFLIGSVAAGFRPIAAQPSPAAAIDSATVPLVVEGNRAFVDLTFVTADGSTRTGRFWIDTGGGAFLLTEALARVLGLEWGEPMQEEGGTLARVLEAPRPFVGEFALEITTDRTLVILDSDDMLPETAPGHADGLLPGHVLARYHVVFDYPGRQFTLARPGTLEPRGEPLPMPVSSPMGFPRTELVVDGESYGLILDTGASFTMVSEAVLMAWGERHPEWPRFEGAHGDAITLGGQTLETMFVHGARWGGYEIGEFGVMSQQEGIFEVWMSRMMTEPIVGALGGNVLKHFRVELDYANEVLYLSRSEAALR